MLKKLLVIVAACAAPAFAQTAVNAAGGLVVTSGTGVAVTPGVPYGAAGPATLVSALPTATLHGGGIVAAGSSESMSGNTRTTTTRYWVNVPTGVETDVGFQRWQRLR